jgi:hypothetical protein
MDFMFVFGIGLALGIAIGFFLAGFLLTSFRRKPEQEEALPDGGVKHVEKAVEKIAATTQPIITGPAVQIDLKQVNATLYGASLAQWQKDIQQIIRQEMAGNFRALSQPQQILPPGPSHSWIAGNPYPFYMPTTMPDCSAEILKAVADAENGRAVLRGWREYKVDRSPDGFFYLKGIYGVTWTSSQMTADVMPTRHNANGLYAYYSLGSFYAVDATLPPGPPRPRPGSPIAECVLWGRVIVCTAGYRAEHCRIEHLWLHASDKDLAAQLSKRYGINVSIAVY